MNHIKLYKLILVTIGVTNGVSFGGTDSNNYAGSGKSGFYGSGKSSYSISEIAKREIARRAQMIRDAQLAIEEGDRLYAQDDFEGSIDQYNVAIALLPSSPRTDNLRNIALSKWADASVAQARFLADHGDRATAIEILDEVLEYDSHHKSAHKLKSYVQDHKRYHPAVTKNHIENIQKVEGLLELGVGQYDSGQFQKAKDTFNEVLRVDRYNSAARKMLEKIERELISTYYKDGRRHMRAKALSAVDELWAPNVPPASLDKFIQDRTTGSSVDEGRAKISAKLNLILPNVNFADGTTVPEALDFLREEIERLDPDPDPTERGLNIVLMVDENNLEPLTGLDLNNAPLLTVLNYIASASGLKLKVEAYAAVLVPATQVTDTMYTRSFSVPPGFLKVTGGEDDGGEADPFADEDLVGNKVGKREDVVDKLKELGVVFGDGATAYFNRGNSQLVVRNTIQNLDVIELYVENQKQESPKQIYITSKFIEITQQNNRELGFDWTLGAFNIGGDQVFGSGGVLGNSSAGAPTAGEQRFPIQFPGTTTPVGQNPLTRGLRFGGDAVSSDTIDGLLRSPNLSSNLSPGIFGLSGVFTDPQFQVLVRGLDQKKGIDVMTAPSVVTKSGQEASIEVIREFIYPEEFEPPEIPDRIATGAGDGGVPSFPITPTTPTSFATRNIGVTLKVLPAIGDDGYTVDLNVETEIVEFEGFINYGSPISGGGTAGNQVVLSQNTINQPLFNSRAIQTNLTIWDGQTVGIGGLIREDVQDVEDKVPVLGDLPLIGRLWQTEAQSTFKRNMMVFITARIIDPSGEPVNSYDELYGEEVTESDDLLDDQPSDSGFEDLMP